MQNQQNTNHVNIKLCVVVVLKPITAKWSTGKTSLNAEFIFYNAIDFRYNFERWAKYFRRLLYAHCVY